METKDIVGWVIAFIIILALYLAAVFVDNRYAESTIILLAICVSFISGGYFMNDRRLTVNKIA